MHVVLGLARHVVVDNHADVVDVDAAGNDVGGDEDVDAARAEVVHHLVAARLLKVAVYLGHVVLVAAQGACQVFDVELRGGEDDDALFVEVVEEVLQHGQFLRLVADDGRLVDVLAGFRYRQLDLGGVGEDGLCQFLDFRWHGGREQQRLPLCGQVLDNLHDVVVKTHVEHTVGLVEDKEGDLAEVDIAHLQVCQQASRGGYHHVGAELEAALLLGKGLAVGAAVDGDRADGEEV